MTTTTNRTILRAYCRQIEPNGTYNSASDEAVLQTTMDYASEAEVDIDDAARSLELAAQRLEVTTNELVAAVTCVAVYTQCRLREALWQLERVVKVVRQIDQGPEDAADETLSMPWPWRCNRCHRSSENLDIDGVCPECATRPEPVNPSENSEYVRLVAFTRLLSNVAEALRLKGRTDAADTVHAEAVHFAGERDIARAASDLNDDLAAGASEDLGPLDDD